MLSWRYPELWRACTGAWSPTVNPAGRLVDWSGYYVDDAVNNGSTAVNVFAGHLAWDFPNNSANFIDINQNSLWFAAGRSITYSAWVRSSNSSAFQAILMADTSSSPRNFQWRLTNTGKLDFIFNQDGVGLDTDNIGSTTVADGNWRHVAVTYYDGGSGNRTVKLYVDGSEDYTEAEANPLSTQSLDLYIGRRNVSSFLQFDGEITDVRIYNRALSGAEMVLLTSLGPGGSYELAKGPFQIQGAGPVSDFSPETYQALLRQRTIPVYHV